MPHRPGHPADTIGHLRHGWMPSGGTVDGPILTGPRCGPCSNRSYNTAAKTFAESIRPYSIVKATRKGADRVRPEMYSTWATTRPHPPSGNVLT